ncbi:MAG: penicillin-binding transpeptidase domain-containing protein, partial [Syntrophales bacterium]|nr:penicillin-binding transpeptidase domain-containing protein [Syntrophales bacterium]
IIKQIEAMDGKILKEYPPEKKGSLSFNQDTIELINSGLWGVVNEGGGTGAAVRRPEADVAGKTGTAQVVGLPSEDKARRMKIVSARFRDHALFVCFAPFDDPEIVVAVVMENAGHGGSAAGPVARKVIDAYFRNKKEGLKKPVNGRSDQPVTVKKQEPQDEDSED